MALRLHAPTPTFAQVKTLAASGAAGCVKAREELKRRTNLSLAKQSGHPWPGART